MSKAYIYKNFGEFEKAAEFFDKARKMDLADRYLNTKASKAFIRIDEIDIADKLIGIIIIKILKKNIKKKGLFAKREEDLTSKKKELKKHNLHEVQCYWYENATARSYLRKKQYNHCLEELFHVESHFEQILSDHFDFHNFCMRKYYLKAYIDMIYFCDQIYSHKFYFKAACCIVDCYMQIFDERSNGTFIEYQVIEKKKKKEVNDDEDLDMKKEINGEKLANEKDPLGFFYKF
jgi:hypothetical protein